MSDISFDTCKCGAVIVSSATAVAELKAENERLRAALKPFAEALKGNWSNQNDRFPLAVGLAHDLRLTLELGDFRRARAALGERT